MQIINIHGFSVNKMYTGIKTRSFKYNEWIDKMLNEMESLPTLEEMKVDPTKPMKIKIIYDTAKGYDLDNLVKSFLDVLVRYYKLEDDNNFTDIRLVRGNKFRHTIEEGAISFEIKNCKGLILNDIDKAIMKLK